MSPRSTGSPAGAPTSIHAPTAVGSPTTVSTSGTAPGACGASVRQNADSNRSQTVSTTPIPSTEMARWCSSGSAGEKRNVSVFSTPSGTVTIARSTVSDSPAHAAVVVRDTSHDARDGDVDGCRERVDVVGEAAGDEAPRLVEPSEVDAVG
jgi:hypothetical protein